MRNPATVFRKLYDTCSKDLNNQFIGEMPPDIMVPAKGKKEKNGKKA